MSSRFPCVALLLLSACNSDSGKSGNPVTPPTGTAFEVIAPTVLSQLGDTLRIVAKLGSQTTATPNVTIVTERRWLHDVGVIQQLSGGVNTAGGAGIATLKVEAFGREKTIDVLVQPTRPVVFSLTSTGDTVVLRGYRMNDVSLQLNGGTLQQLSRDSANSRLRFTLNTGASCAGGGRITFTLLNADALVPLTAVARRQEDVILSVGETARLSDAISCLRLRASSGAVYHLGYFDSRSLEAARTRPAGATTISDFTFSIGDRTNGPSATSAISSAQHVNRERPFVDEVEQNQSGPNDFLLRQTPWAAGDTFSAATPWGTFPMTAIKTYGDYFVWSVRTSDAPRLTPVMRARADSTFEHMVGPGMALYDSAYGLPRPLTNASMNQYMVNSVILRVDSGPGPGSISGNANPTLVNMVFQVDTPLGAEGSTSLLSHEYTHARDLFNQQNTGTNGARDTWSTEGIATFFTYETIRRLNNIAFDANTVWENNGNPSPTRGYVFRLEPWFNQGEIDRGYGDAAPFIRDAVQRVMRSGRSYYEAVREVARAVGPSWYGCDFSGNCARTGFAERMPALLGMDWDPINAMLTYMLSQSADDLTTNPELQNTTFARVGERAIQLSAGPKPKFTLVSGSGSTFSASLYRGSAGYVIIQDSNGGSYQILSTPPLKWMLLRVK